jgi:hypothetical protein
MHIHTDGIFEAFDATLDLIEDEEQRARVRRVLDASRDSVQRAVHDLIGAAVHEVNEAAGGSLRADLIYGPDGLELNVSTPDPAEPRDDATVEIDFDASEIERLTLRLPAELKEIAASAAEGAGVSLNTWLTRLVTQEAGRTRRRERGRHRRGDGGGQSLKGWIGG